MINGFFTLRSELYVFQYKVIWQIKLAMLLIYRMSLIKMSLQALVAEEKKSTGSQWHERLDHETKLILKRIKTTTNSDYTDTTHLM